MVWGVKGMHHGCIWVRRVDDGIWRMPAKKKLPGWLVVWDSGVRGRADINEGSRSQNGRNCFFFTVKATSLIGYK